jgi:hypothetical protein
MSIMSKSFSNAEIVEQARLGAARLMNAATRPNMLTAVLGINGAGVGIAAVLIAAEALRSELRIEARLDDSNDASGFLHETERVALSVGEEYGKVRADVIREKNGGTAMSDEEYNARCKAAFGISTETQAPEAA